MADYYTKLSVELPTAGVAPRKIAQWLNAIDKASEQLKDADPDQWQEHYGGLEIRESPANQGDAVWVHGDNPEGAAQVESSP